MLATLVFEPQRLATSVGAAPLTRTETHARFVFWSRLGGELGITNLPERPEALREWMLDYEQRTYRFTPAGRRVADAVIADWAARWLPCGVRGTGALAVHALLDHHLATTHRITPPPWPLRVGVKAAMHAQLAARRVHEPSHRHYITALATARPA